MTPIRHLARGLLAAAVMSAAPVQAADKDLLRLGLDTLPLSFGVPYRTAAIPTLYTTSAMFDGLTRIEADGTLKPWLATAWHSTDGLTWTFTLRDDVNFSNGVKLTAEAFKVAVDYLTSPEALKEGLIREIPPLKAARVIDARTIEITLAEADAMFPRSAAALYVAEPGQWQALGRDGFGQKPVGTGPYALERWEPNRGVFTAFEGSWRKPRVARLEIVAVPDRTARLQGLIAGQIDVALGLSAGDMASVEAAGGTALRIPTSLVNGWSFMLMRDGKPNPGPWQDVRVRRAMTMAIDRQVIVDALLDGAGRVATQPATQATFGHNPALAPLPYDPDAAKKLLAEAGYPNGFSMSLMVTTGGVGVDTEVAQKAADDLSRIGVKVTIETEPMAQYLQHLSRAGFPTDAFSSAWPSDPNIDAIRPMRMHSCLRREPFYCDPAIMPRIAAALTAMDPAEALTLRHEVMAFYHEQAPGIYFYEGTLFVGLAPRVRDFSSAFNMIAFDKVWLAQ